MGLASLKLHLAIIKDKSVDTFEQNKRFLLASFRNFKKVFFVDSLTPLSPPSMLKYAKWTPSCGTNIERVEMWILETKKLTSSTKQVFFGECLNCFCPWLKCWDKLLKLKETNISTKHNRLKNPSWREVYKHERGVKLGSTEKQLQFFSSMSGDLNLRLRDLSSVAITLGHATSTIPEIICAIGNTLEFT